MVSPECWKRSWRPRLCIPFCPAKYKKIANISSHSTFRVGSRPPVVCSWSTSEKKTFASILKFSIARYGFPCKISCTHAAPESSEVRLCSLCRKLAAYQELILPTMSAMCLFLRCRCSRRNCRSSSLSTVSMSQWQPDMTFKGTGNSRHGNFPSCG